MNERKKIEKLHAELASKDATTQLLWQQLEEARKAYVKQYEAEGLLKSQNGQINELRQQLSEIDAVANAHAYEIIDVKRRILDELYKFPAIELLNVLLELRRKPKKENDE